MSGPMVVAMDANAWSRSYHRAGRKQAARSVCCLEPPPPMRRPTLEHVASDMSTGIGRESKPAWRSSKTPELDDGIPRRGCGVL